jgi:hypothetical protein
MGILVPRLLPGKPDKSLLKHWRRANIAVNVVLLGFGLYTISFAMEMLADVLLRAATSRVLPGGPT